MKRTIVWLSLTGVTALLVGCATSYHSLSFTGGYSETHISGNLYEIKFNGNSYISYNRINEYLLLRAAQLGKRKHKKYFTIYSSPYAALRGIDSYEPISFTAADKPNGYIYVVYKNTKIDYNSFSVDNTYKKYKHYLD